MKIKRKYLYLLFLFVICLGFGFVLKNTYAKFASGYETSNDIANLNLSFNLKISNLEEYEEITVDKGDYEVFNVNVKNSSGSTSYYGIWYQMVSPKSISSDIVIARSSDSTVNTSGSISNGGDVTTTIIVKNNSSSSIKINIGVASSLKSTSDIEYLGGKKLISGTTDIPGENLFDLVKKDAVMDNIKSTYVSSSTGIDFSNISSDTNGKGVYIRSGTESNTYPIYYYRGDVTNNNVLFAGYCWKIVRTTETGGVKLIYNGESKDKYDSTVIEEKEYTNVTNDATYPYTYDSTSKTWTSTNKTNSATGTITFGVKTAGVYLFNYTVSSEKKYDKAILYKDGTKIGEYSGSVSDSISLGELTTSSVLKVEYTKDISGSSGDDNVVFSIAKAYGDVKKVCNNTGSNAQIGTSSFNSDDDSPAQVGYVYGSVHLPANKDMSAITDSYYYGRGVTYSNGTYTLTNTMTSNSWSSIWNVYNRSDGIFNHHYSCLSTSNSCSNVYYIFGTTSSKAYYITLSNGKKVEDALGEMLDDNITDSTIKTFVDDWYNTNVDSKGYTSYLEDTVWCNDRSIYEKNGWAPEEESSSDLYFNGYNLNVPNLTCSRSIDKFTVSNNNGNGILKYPVGLLDSNEVMLAGGKSATNNSSYYLYSGEIYWLNTPHEADHAGIPYLQLVSGSGSISSLTAGWNLGVRPSISLAHKTRIISGDGGYDSPYKVQ